MSANCRLRPGMRAAHGHQHFLHGAGAKGIGGNTAVAHPQHQHRPLCRQQRPQLRSRQLDHPAVPLVQHRDAGYIQGDIPALGPRQPLLGDLHPCHGDCPLPGCGQPHPCGQGGPCRAKQLIRQIRLPHFVPLSFSSGRFAALCRPPRWAEYGQCKKILYKKSKNACVGTANMVS